MSNVSFNEYFAKKKELEEIVKGLGKTQLKTLFKEYFDAHPEVYGFEWDQYTPHFNDGEPCEFGLHGCYIFKTKEVFEDGETYNVSEEHADLVEESWNDEPCDMLEGIEEILQEVFGDGVKVRVTRTKMEVVEIDHD